MEKSKNYQKRQELLEKLETPSIGDASRELGDTLAIIVFKECHEGLKEEFGLKPPLQGSGDELWVSPSDLLIGKILLKPPLTQKHIQALTHQGILEIGYDIELKFINEKRLEKEREMKELEEYLKRICEIQKNILVKDIREQERQKYEARIRNIHKYFQHQIADILITMCYALIDCEKEAAEWHAKEMERVQHANKAAYNKIVHKLTVEFLVRLGEQEALLVECFREQLESLDATRICQVRYERAKGVEKLEFYKHRLRCQNVANLMYILCKERHKCQREKFRIESNYLNKIRANKAIILRKSHLIRKLQRIKKRKMQQIEVREKCLVEIILQFRRLIYIAIDAAPKHAEFLLSIQRLMDFDLQKFCVDEKKDDNDNIVQEILKNDLLPENLEDENVGIKSEHVSEETIPIKLQSDVLPAVYFNKKMYVREDFRNMISQGIEINEGHPLWNHDVEELMKILKASVTEVAEHPEIESLSSSHGSDSIIFNSNQDPYPFKHIELIQKSTQTSTLQCSLPKMTDSNQEKEINATEMDEKDATSKRSSEKSRPSNSSMKRKSSIVSKNRPDTNSKLELARDSLIIRISSFEKKSLTMTLSSVASAHAKSSTDSIKKEAAEVLSQSKILAACDSVELLRSQSQSRTQLVGEQLKEEEEEEEEEKKKKKKVPLPSKHNLVEKKGKKLDKRTKAGTAGSSKPDESEQDVLDFHYRAEKIVETVHRNPSLMRLFTGS